MIPILSFVKGEDFLLCVCRSLYAMITTRII